MNILIYSIQQNLQKTFLLLKERILKKQFPTRWLPNGINEIYILAKYFTLL